MEHFSDKRKVTWRAAANTAVSKAAGTTIFFFMAALAHR
ncbi:MAG: hypothetical protein JWR80_6246 [Bradyrhizobium sp.]|nr:hypothetical protein [Bradyrhizobium sp.]